MNMMDSLKESLRIWEYIFVYFWHFFKISPNDVYNELYVHHAHFNKAIWSVAPLVPIKWIFENLDQNPEILQIFEGRNHKTQIDLILYAKSPILDIILESKI